MRWLFETLVGRTVVVLLLGIATVQGSSLWFYEATLNSEAVLANEKQLAERLTAIYRAVLHIPPRDRDALTHDLAGGVIEAHWGLQRRASADPLATETWAGLRDRLVAAVPAWAENGLVIGSDQANASSHLAAISMQLPDGSWLNVDLLASHSHHSRSDSAILSTTLMAFGVVIVAVLLIRWLTRPLERFAEAARKLYASADRAPVPETGPYEIRTLAHAFNEMQGRIRRLITARTQALAAVSHDLKTPLTRLRMRIDEIGNAETQRAIAADLSEMEAMIDATLSYLRGDRSDEEMRPVDLIAIIATIADDARDAGDSVSLDAPRSIVVHGRHLALKRALTNLIQNAIKYGGVAAITVRAEHGQARVCVADEGPGIPDQDMDAMFEPFVRLDHSRNRGSGGFGLGLTIANEIVRAHGGTISLANRTEGGLCVTVLLEAQSD
ncbi:ATP-binding protein [Phreatobacter stygius]|uniref:histidine kinase n=1 Tax=Phreatobacter stygius TaxID=1940610 RepID=A0A4D7AV64_9HYPH|nr:ATP-binding protein [Phreatobacter stygius]QCI64809.1 HAMP domain-containing protein [Phreatobacter stygius]